MTYFTGIVLALLVSVFARIVGLDRDRAFYPAVLAVVASYYDLFAVMGGSMHAMVKEAVVTAIFLAAVALGFKRNLWIIVGALIAHGLLDFVHGQLIANPGVPMWWPMFCLSYDVTAAAWLAGLLLVRDQALATGSLKTVASAVKRTADSGVVGPVLIFDDTTGRSIDIDTRGSEQEVLARLATHPANTDGRAESEQPGDPLRTAPDSIDADAPANQPRGRGRPKLGVVAREVTLLPRHWDWSSAQPGSASVALRKARR